MVWNRPDDPNYYSCAGPLNGDGRAYLKDGTEKILARKSMFYNANDPRSQQYETEMPVSRMSYVPSFENPYTPLSSFEPIDSVRDMFVRGDHAYVANGFSGLVVVDVNPASPDYLTALDSRMSPIRKFQPSPEPTVPPPDPSIPAPVVCLSPAISLLSPGWTVDS